MDCAEIPTASLDASVTTQQIVLKWFAKFRIGNFNLTNHARSRPNSKVNNDILKVTIESDSFQCAYELPLKLGVGKQTILTHLGQIGNLKKLDKQQVSHEFNEK